MSIIPRIVGAIGTGGGGGGGTTYAKWNSADKNASITLSNSDLTVNSVTNVRAARGTISKSTGKWYFEMTPGIDGGGQSRTIIGVGNATASLSSYVGNDANGWGYGSFDGWRYHSGGAATGTTAPAGAVIGVAVDLDSGTVKFYRASTGALIYTFSGVSGTLYPMISGDYNAANATANFGASAFTMTVPTGYNSGWYS